jgi:CubicO group peptidase (beta-lactamase class C family)
MNKHSILAAALAYATIANPVSAQARPTEATLQSLAQVDDVVLEQMTSSHLPGVAVAVVDHGKILKLSGYGSANLEWNAQVDPDTRFQLASATKVFTAVSLMRLVEQRRLKLDQPISDFFQDAPESWHSITVRMLANHTSGLDEDLGEPRPKTVADAVAAAMKRPLAYEPGSEARYGFTDFTILRAILEKTTGMTLPEIFRTEITDPLGMSATAFATAAEGGPVRTSDVLTKRSSIYAWDGERQRTSEFFFEPLGYGAGGLYSSARDLARFSVALDNEELLSSSSMAELTTPATLPDGSKAGFGIGWTVKTYRGVPAVGHSGGPALADILRIPSRGLSVIVLTNQQIFYPLLAERIADLYLPEPSFQVIADRQPTLTGRFRLALETLDPATEAEGSNALEPLRSSFGQAYLTGVGPVKSVRLLSERNAGDEIVRVYLVEFARKSDQFLAITDRAGFLRTIRPN